MKRNRHTLLPRISDEAWDAIHTPNTGETRLCSQNCILFKRPTSGGRLTHRPAFEGKCRETREKVISGVSPCHIREDINQSAKERR